MQENHVGVLTKVYQDEDEKELIHDCISGKPDAQKQFYLKYAPKMMIVCLRYSTTKPDAEDLLQEGFLKVFKNLAQFNGAGSLEGWVRRIFVNTALAKFRDKNKLMPIVTMENIEQSSDEYLQMAERIDGKVLLKLVQSLPAAYKIVFNLYVFEGYKHKEIAEMLHISEGTSKSNLHDARKILQHLIQIHTKIAN
ncbi:MAG: sigma-70 family RNA polymerase sigma factor [Sphingobacteriales bacterium]|uniref:RNA polymerase sigma factor n=1 Tax=Hydrotalea flava TaxID=714549 RepID=UPI0008329C77|nr:sigma-70 family RNA polymerase sigma factor [Hydrotalea flava]RTL54371.1 MAG: sigma-70 family RNA polymerase sigma factor [Sphingobacteriales bacterium]